MYVNESAVANQAVTMAVAWQGLSHIPGWDHGHLQTTILFLFNFFIFRKTVGSCWSFNPWILFLSCLLLVEFCQWYRHIVLWNCPELPSLFPPNNAAPEESPWFIHGKLRVTQDHFTEVLYCCACWNRFLVGFCVYVSFPCPILKCVPLQREQNQ